MSKKGFSMVELSIVLVVIGLIVGMAIKGLSLIELASFRAEVAKIGKIENAFKSYYVMKNSLPRKNRVSNYYDTRELIDLNLISEEDFQVKEAFFPWRVSNCLALPVSEGEEVTGGYKNSGSDLCVWMESAPTPLMCNLETMADDRSLQSGLGRQEGAQDEGLSEEDFKNCKKAKYIIRNFYGFMLMSM